MKAFNPLADFVCGRHVTLLGSAPTCEGRPVGTLTAAVNGSAAAFGLSRVDMLFVNSFALRGNFAVRKAVRKALSGMSCRFLVVIDAAGSGLMPQVLAEQTFIVPSAQRSALLEHVTGDSFAESDGGDAVPSTGVTAALLLRKLGAHVRLHGFSLADGHALLPGSERSHKAMDAKYLPLFDPVCGPGELASKHQTVPRR